MYLYEILTFDFDMWGVSAEVRKKNKSSFEERAEMQELERETRRLERILRPARSITWKNHLKGRRNAHLNSFAPIPT